QQRASLRLDRRPDQLQMGLLRRAAPLPHIACHAGADNVFPAALAAAAARNDMVETQFARGKMPPAILTLVAVPGEKVAAVKSQRLPWNAIEGKEADHPGHLQLEIDP